MTGIGFRRDFAEELLASNQLTPDFIEVAPENWIEVGGYWKKLLDKALERYPLFTHGLSLSIGSPDPLDYDFLRKIKQFLNDTGATLYSEHLSFAKCDNAHLYELLPIPFTSEAVKHVSSRIREVQEILERRIAIEIVSYYTAVTPELSELEFVNAILEEADCDLLLDVNNIYVNGFNHNYDPEAFIRELPLQRVRYIHMAGHEQVSEDLIIDTHGQAIVDPVYQLFSFAMQQIGRPVPVLLERDFNIPELQEMQHELQQLKKIQKQALTPQFHGSPS